MMRTGRRAGLAAAIAGSTAWSGPQRIRTVLVTAFVMIRLRGYKTRGGPSIHATASPKQGTLKRAQVP